MRAHCGVPLDKQREWGYDTIYKLILIWNLLANFLGKNHKEVDIKTGTWVEQAVLVTGGNMVEQWQEVVAATGRVLAPYENDYVTRLEVLFAYRSKDGSSKFILRFHVYGEEE